MRKIITDNYIRITKREARILYETDQKVLYFCPVNLNPDSMWRPACGPMYQSLDGLYHMDFQSAINNFEYYNCINSETGKYTAFYVPRKWYELRRAAALEFSPDGPAHTALSNYEEAGA